MSDRSLPSKVRDLLYAVNRDLAQTDGIQPVVARALLTTQSVVCD